MTKQRNYGIDLLRIVLMFMIVVGHLFAHTNIRTDAEVYSPKWIYAWIIQTVVLCAVDCFVIITGYYSNHNDRSIRLKKIVLLSGQVLFYSVSVYAVLLVTGLIDFSIVDLVKTLLPVMSGQYWFFTSYILLMLLVPFINLMLNRLNDFALKFLTATIIFVFYCMPIFSAVLWQFDGSEGMGIIGFITLYIIGYALKRFDLKLSKLVCIVGIFISCSIIFASKLVLTYIVESFSLDMGTGLFYHYNTLFMLVNAVLIFLLFKQISVGSRTSKLVSFVSVSVFGVYLIHEYPKMWDVFWKSDIARVLREASFLEFVALSILIPLAIFVVCLIIDKIRRMVAKQLACLGFVQKLDAKLSSLDNYLLEKFETQG